ncbi:MAG: hypothetical protein QXY20_09490 [Thermofilum sp.]|uniref:hypothetical protein n=1 Tax=Thermofilum sp. TaxID=1961369 RepID=UPI00315FF930
MTSVISGDKKMQELVSNPQGAGVNAPNVKLGPRQIWALKLLEEEGGAMMLYKDSTGGDKLLLSLEDIYERQTKSPVYAPYNTRRIIGSLEKKGLVEVRDVECPYHPGRMKKFVFLTLRGRHALWALSEK